ncbi:GGDEF domain-containing protein [Methylobacter tundripaludum]|uniref:GGDEF domain-containing protein n=1 Tax=Methylobacter tundripaludum TaxID=173365 RepID=UPI0015E3EEFD|nr:sensor domain-containing diguanylate cyclase [Methylobacter tundripaludum]
MHNSQEQRRPPHGRNTGLLHLENIMESLGDGVFSCDKEGLCIYVNRAALELMDLSISDVLGKDLRPAFHQHYAENRIYLSNKCLIRRTTVDGQPRRGDHIFRHKNGRLIPVHLNVQPLVIEGELDGVVVVFHDISERVNLIRRLEELALYDPLTGLPNRRQLDDRLKTEFARLRRYGGEFTLILLDLDHFKQVNDSFGHPAGDVVLKAIAEALQKSLRANDLPSRLGGEEFAVLLPDTGLEEAGGLAERLRQTIEAMPIDVGKGQTINVTVSAGVARAIPSLDKETAIDAADQALYRAKVAGRNRVELAT